MNRAQFDAAVARFRETGAVDTKDYFTLDRPAYRLATVTVECPIADVAACAGRIAAVVAEVGGHMSMHVYRDTVTIFGYASRDLEPDEIGEPSVAVRMVE